MEKKFLTIDELSQYLGVKKSNLYSKVERREIPFYRWGRRIMFKKDEIDAFMEKCKVESEDIEKEAKRILKGATNSNLDVEGIVKKAIEEAMGKRYTSSQGKPNQDKGSGKEVSNGTL